MSAYYSYPNAISSWGYGFARRAIPKAFPYFLTTPTTTLAVDLATTKQHLRIASSMTADDSYITMLINAVTAFAEDYTKRDFITKGYTTYRDNFCSNLIQLRKSPFRAISTFQYLVNNVWTTVPSTLYFINEDVAYNNIMLLGDQVWPTNMDTNRLQTIRIVFTAGYGALATDIPILLREGMLQHIAQMYENRGDCSGDGGASACSSALPAQAKLIYSQYRILDITGAPY